MTGANFSPWVIFGLSQRRGVVFSLSWEVETIFGPFMHKDLMRNFYMWNDLETTLNFVFIVTNSNYKVSV